MSRSRLGKVNNPLEQTRMSKYFEANTNNIRDLAEERLLLRFKEVLDRYEILYAWNGFNFDFPILRRGLDIIGKRGE